MDLKVSIIQSDLVWENKEKNLDHFYSCIANLKDKSDLVILPETFSTGFSMNPGNLAETITGKTIELIKSWAAEFNIAIAGSFISKEENAFYNRALFVTPEKKALYYDKRHLFRMGGENDVYTPGNSYSIIPYKGWNIRIIICYDLRFPVWIRNKNEEYDLLICVANWPKARAKVWNILLEARAIENSCYVCGVNRIGEDGNGLAHQGDSSIIDFKGNILSKAQIDTEETITLNLSKEKLIDFRNKFPVGKDADSFAIL